MPISKIQKKSENVLSAYYNAEDKETNTLFMGSDIHLDSPNCDRELLKKHLEQAKNRNALINLHGDIFDVMGAWQDPRTKMGDIDPQFISDEHSYLDMVVDYAYEFFKPYAEHIMLISEGNHETEIARRRDTNIIARLVRILNEGNDHADIAKGEYAGYVRHRFAHKGVRDRKNITVHYHHGKDGHAPRSKDMLQSQLQSFHYNDADLIVSGHTHQKWHDPNNRVEKLTRSDKIVYQTKHVVKLGSYKEKTTSGRGFEHKKEMFPMRLGGWFAHMIYSRENPVQILMEEAI